MTFVAPGSSVSYTQPQLPPQPTHTVTGQETVTQIAQQYGVTPEELARGNNLSVDSALSPGQVLTLPAHAVAATAAQAAPAAQTPAQKTDAAIAAYQAALKQRDQDLQNAPRNGALRADLDRTEQGQIDTAKQAMDKAIADEIAGEVALRNQGVPMEFRTPTAQLIDSAGQAIEARHPGDPTLTATIDDSVQACQLQNTVNSLIPDYYGDWSAADKLKGIVLDGQPQNVVDGVLADPRVQGWIKDAATQVDQTYNAGPAENQAPAAAQQLLATVQNLPPPLATAVVQQSMPTIQKIAQCEMVYGGQGAFATMQRVVSAMGEGPQAQDLAKQIAGAYLHQAERWSGFTYDATKLATSDGANPTLAMALANALRQDGKSEQADGITTVATQGLHEFLANGKDSPLQAYNNAHSARLDKDRRLSQLLANAGPLTDPQKQAFIRAFNNDPDNAKVYQADTAAGQNLAAYMNAHQSDLLAAAARSPDGAAQLYQCMQDVAQSGQGKTALAFADAVQADPQLTQAFSGFSDYQKTFLPNAIASAQGQLLVEAKGDTQSATTQLLSLAAPLFQGKEGWSAIVENYKALGENKQTAFDPKQLGESFAELGPAGKGMAMASIMVNAYNGTQASTISSMINSYASAGGNAAGLASGALQSLVDADKLGAFTGSAEALANFSSRLIPGLALIASTSAFASDFSSMQSDPVYAGAVVGDLFSVIGSALETTGAGEVPGAFINGIGSLLAAPFQFAGSLIDGNKNAAQLHADVVKYLGQGGVGLDDATTKALADSDPDQVKQWLATGMPADKLQTLAKLDPQMLQSDHGYGPSIGWLPDLQKRTGLSGMDLYNMLMQSEQGASTPGTGVWQVLYVLGHPSWSGVGGAQTSAQLAADFRSYAQQLQSNGGPDQAEDTERANALLNAAGWLDHH